MRKTILFALLFTCAAAGSSFGQGKVFNWLPANDESVRLDPAYYHTGRVYRSGPQGGNIHVDIEAQQPVTIFMTPNEEWTAAMQHPEVLGDLKYLCLQEHVVKTTYVCDLPPDRAIVLIIQDERNADRAVFAGLGTVLEGRGSIARQFVSPNDMHIQYYRWGCAENCYQPKFRWIREVKEKYELTPVMKVYGGLTPERDGEQISVKIKSPVPMAVGVVPSQIADQLFDKPEMFDSALAKAACKQRGIQSLQFECTLSMADGPQSLVLLPERSANIPAHKKAEVELLASKCVLNCAPISDKQ